MIESTHHHTGHRNYIRDFPLHRSLDQDPQDPLRSRGHRHVHCTHCFHHTVCTVSGCHSHAIQRARRAGGAHGSLCTPSDRSSGDAQRVSLGPHFLLAHVVGCQVLDAPNVQALDGGTSVLSTIVVVCDGIRCHYVCWCGGEQFYKLPLYARLVYSW